MALAVALLAFSLVLPQVSAQKKEIAWSVGEKPLADTIHGLRALPDDVRARTTKDLALKIRALPGGLNKLRLAVGLANLATEGDFGHDTLQEVTTTLEGALREHPIPWPQAEAAAGTTAASAGATSSAGAASSAGATSAGEGARGAPAAPYM